MKTTITIERKELKAAAMATTNDALRPAMRGVLAQINNDDTLTLFSTDGHILTAINLNGYNRVLSNGNELESIIIPESVLKQFSKCTNKTSHERINISYVVDETPTERNEGTTLKTSYLLVEDCTNATKQIVEPELEKYPNCKAVIPSELSGVVAQFDPSLLLKLEKAVQTLHGNETRVHVSHNGNGAAVAIAHKTNYRDSTQIDNFYGLVMPILSKEQNTNKPGWV